MLAATILLTVALHATPGAHAHTTTPAVHRAPAPAVTVHRAPAPADRAPRPWCFTGDLATDCGGAGRLYSCPDSTVWPSSTTPCNEAWTGSRTR
jgi:hypothetical protein